ncbi:MAG: hypothetical protein A3H59_03265 [Candidatus Jacksonbacteria bacterium RIFCSPLOWO2_02_FULL_43_9]|nr:MAG: hypothetical protein UV70_C0005G0090 [Parcubacteria group bacterium GW2011_GWA2_43_13]OGY71353.1 MAG: hypothetical protein A2986_03780 [Candidatus Jacksonbacteria bacterium RIFCSPLOWO2_01_FULL_44_13]OGY73299.1 MAG: hypothetical protein A3H59_03265 [Candidatus Jacksonbacteria bacterium RIFCSPLOWO2_02_FULL_43_9]
MLIHLLSETIHTKNDLHAAKRKWARTLHIPIPPNRALLKDYHERIKKGEVTPDPLFLHMLKRRTIRTISGVAPVTVLTKPFPCPGRCVYCPTERGMPKSYLSNEPAAARALKQQFDPYKQIVIRLHSFYENGHRPEKIELIVLGGTWSFYPRRYQTWFIKRCFQAMNDFIFHYDTTHCTPYRSSHNQLLKETHDINQTAQHRCVGLTLETRPDHITKTEIKRMRALGATRVQLGVQSTHDDVLTLIKRDQTRDQVRDATRWLKDAGFKINYHTMPNLPGSNLQKDTEMYNELFQHPDFKPDEMKIYPTVLPSFTPIMEKMWRDGIWKPYTDDELITLLAHVKHTIIPPYVRIARLIRDIPATSIIAGSKISNLREHIQAHMQKKGLLCKCIRCREELGRNQSIDSSNAECFIEPIDTTGGKEYFLSFETSSSPSPKIGEGRVRYEKINILPPPPTPSSGRRGGESRILHAFLRLRLPDNITHPFISELKGCAIIREVHSYGQLTPLNGKEVYTSQHTGLGKQLIQKAESIARDHGYKKMAVISGIGTREYYKKLGYELEKIYMIKHITS